MDSQTPPKTPNPWVIAAFYKFADFTDYQERQPIILKFCNDHKIKGILLLAREGMNGTVAGHRHDMDQLLTFLKSDPRFSDLEHKESFESKPPFRKMKVRLKKEIVTLGVPDLDPNQKKGTYVPPHQWNALISDTEVVVIDTRNDYEYQIGSFQNAINPKTDSFREFPEYVKTHLNPSLQKKVAMYCTGGIRCEKATALMLKLGFKEVYHLQGGILKYLEQIPQDKSLWRGECFVFDQRVSVTNTLEKGSYRLCYACQYPVSDDDARSEKYREGISCPRCFDQLTPEQMARAKERQRQHEQLRGV